MTSSNKANFGTGLKNKQPNVSSTSRESASGHEDRSPASAARAGRIPVAGNSSPDSGEARKIRPAFFSSETIIAVIATVSILLYLILRYLVSVSPSTATIPLYVILVIGGVPILFDLAHQLIKRELGTDVLAGLAIVTSVMLGEYLVGAIIVLMFSGGIALEQYATHRASSVLDALARRMPRIAHKNWIPELRKSHLTKSQ